ncbi:hypothetical protein J3Q64DRAFT_1820767 [Phycomyces blakesleeanus]|uniref:Uncharacterized protein n=1 Tax=Phycomyces blakesleeanus TaxID=4837 RepID=A0ABR3B1X0_PHYBL
MESIIPGCPPATGKVHIHGKNRFFKVISCHLHALKYNLYATYNFFNSPVSSSDKLLSDIRSPSVDLNDILFGDQITSDPRLPDHVEEDWEDIYAKMIQQMYNTTSVILPSPIRIIAKHTHTDKKNVPEFSKHAHSIFDSESLSIKDLFSYRQLRSENLLHRMIHCLNVNCEDQSSIIRLSKGVFVHQKWQTVPKCNSPTLSMFEDCFLQSLDNVDAPIDTFDYSSLDFISSQTTPSSISASTWSSTVATSFLKYTFGVRYTNPYGGASDVLIRGRLPLWCHNLFLAECARQMPIKPNETRYGLFPFAPHVPVTFGSMDNYAATIEGEPTPDLTVVYERIAMELIEPEFAYDEFHDSANVKQEILKHILYCDIPDNVAQWLSSLADSWATPPIFFS